MSKINLKSKKNLLIATVVLLALLLVIGTTLAFLTDSRSTLNVLGIGQASDGKQTVSIKLEEAAFVSQIEARIATYGATAGEVNPSNTDEVTTAKMYNIVPGEKIAKDPVITNTGSEAVYVRVRVLDLSNTDIFENLFFKDATDGLGLAPNKDWVKIGDYYYYSINAAATGTGSQLAVGASADIFKYSDVTNKISMVIPEKWDYADITVSLQDIKVEVQAIQSRGFTPDLTLTNPWQYSDNSPVAFAY